jgi:mRNA-degrading endonuclease HigB of HigAB toxin-antitoxin module
MTDDRITPEEMREFMNWTQAHIEMLHEELTTIRDGLSNAASQPAASNTTVFVADEISYDFMDGKKVFKLRGNEYRMFGVRVWDEVLPTLGIDPTKLQPGTTKIEPVKVMVKMIESTDEATGETKSTPRKVIGRA